MLRSPTGVFFADSQRVARLYAGPSGRIHHALLSGRVVPWERALPAFQRRIARRIGEWTDADVEAFGRHAAIHGAEAGRDEMDATAAYALQARPDHTDTDCLLFLMPGALRDLGADIVSREYESGAGSKTGETEYMVFDPRLISPARPGPAIFPPRRADIGHPAPGAATGRCR